MLTKKEVELKNCRISLKVLKQERDRIESRLPQLTSLILEIKTSIFLTNHEIKMGDRIKIVDGKKTFTGTIKGFSGGIVILEDKLGKIKKKMLSKKNVKITKIN